MRYIFFICLPLIFSSCSFFNSEKELGDYMQWIHNEDNGLVKSKHINGLIFTVKYLPAEYMAYQELKDSNAHTISKDSLIKQYRNTLFFLLTVNSDDEMKENAGKDVMYLGVKNPKEYQERVMLMNFNMKEFISIQLNDSSTYSPVLTNMENTYGLSNGRSILCVFAPYKSIQEFNNSNTIDLIWDDEIFQSGRNHFVFDSKDFLSLPRLKF